MKRLPDWQSRLVAFLHQSRAEPFAYGKHDCTLFAARAVEAMTGEDLAKGWKYKTYEGGIKALRKAGYDDQVAFVAAHFDECPVVFAQPGDIAVIDSPEGQALGIVQGQHVYVLSPMGLALVPTLSAIRAFRV